jgi:hypothetical protein
MTAVIGKVAAQATQTIVADDTFLQLMRIRRMKILDLPHDPSLEKIVNIRYRCGGEFLSLCSKRSSKAMQ